MHHIKISTYFPEDVGPRDAMHLKGAPPQA